MKLDHVLRLSVRACEGGINEITIDRFVDNEAAVIDAVNMFLAAIGVSARVNSLLNPPVSPRFPLGPIVAGVADPRKSGSASAATQIGGGVMSGY